MPNPKSWSENLKRKLSQIETQRSLRTPRIWENVSPEDQGYAREFSEKNSRGSLDKNQQYLRVVAQLLIWLNKPLSSLTSRDLNEYQVFLQSPTPDFQSLPEYAFLPANEKAIDDSVGVISLFCVFLQKKGILKNNPTKNVKRLRPSTKDENPNLFSPHKWQMLQQYISTLPLDTPGQRNQAERLRYCVSVGYGLALRPDEMQRHHQGMIYKDNDGRYKINIEGKDKKVRILILDDATVGAMERYNLYLVGKENLGKYPIPFLPAVKPVRSKGCDDTKVFEILDGVSENAWQKAFKKHLIDMVSKVNNIPLNEVVNDLAWQEDWAEVTPYSLRHTRLCHMLHLEKRDILEVYKFAGHANLYTTEKYLSWECI